MSKKERFNKPLYLGTEKEPGLADFQALIWNKDVHPCYTAGGKEANLTAGGAEVPGTRVEHMELTPQAQHVAYLYGLREIALENKIEELERQLKAIDLVLHPPAKVLTRYCPYCGEENSKAVDDSGPWECWNCDIIFTMEDLDE